jgi:hypothetical protein
MRQRSVSPEAGENPRVVAGRARELRREQLRKFPDVVDGCVQLLFVLGRL